jgi:phosphoacetylglucosamine mutase
MHFQCGADFVKIQARVPAGFDDVPANARCASLDGDADRLVYFFPLGFGLRVRLLDGDHISALFATFIKQVWLF